MWRLDGFGSHRYRLQRFSGKISVSIIYRDWKKIQREGFAKWQKPVPKAFCAQQSFITWKTSTVVKRRLLRLRWIKRRFQYYTQLTTVYKYGKNGKRYKFDGSIYIYINRIRYFIEKLREFVLIDITLYGYKYQKWRLFVFYWLNLN